MQITWIKRVKSTENVIGRLFLKLMVQWLQYFLNCWPEPSMWRRSMLDNRTILRFQEGVIGGSLSIFKCNYGNWALAVCVLIKTIL